MELSRVISFVPVFKVVVPAIERLPPSVIGPAAVRVKVPPIVDVPKSVEAFSATVTLFPVN